ncbi:MAG: hypothetical protein IH860_01220 [Chloroflexi bacterium]|nr:hypothetical protein [Chloroflexota bacterium]
MITTLQIRLDVQFHQLEDIEEADALARKENGAIYTWKTVGRSNWLEKNPRCVDALGLVVLPKGLPDFIEMADDLWEEDDEEVFG